MTKPYVPQIIANWIEKESQNFTVSEALKNQPLPESVQTYLELTRSSDQLIEAWNNGYQIDEGTEGSMSAIIPESEEDLMVTQAAVGDKNLRIVSEWQGLKVSLDLDSDFATIINDGRGLIIDTNFLDGLTGDFVDVDYIMYDMRKYEN